MSEDYRGSHRAPTSADDVAAPFHDVEEMMPDYYEHPEYYSHDGRNSPVSRESNIALKAARGNPNAMVTIYRALPPGFTSINPGDWVTQSLTYARQHAMSNGADDWPVIKAQVPAKTLWTEGYVCEWGYSGPSISARTASLVPHEAALPTSGLYYRTHDHSRPFAVEDARSAPLWEHSTAPVKQGYSALANPWDLWVYLLAYGWLQPRYIDNDDVICFSGTPKRGKGNDGEPLVIPDMKTVVRYSWPEFERLLLTTPRPPKPGGPGAKHQYFEEWTHVANHAFEKTSFSPVARMLCNEALVAIGMEPKYASAEHAGDVMIALRPSEVTCKVIAEMDECTEPIEDLHLTLFYLGSIEDVGGEAGKERLYRGLYNFAINSGYRGLTGTLNGFGVFSNEQDTLIALWDIPGIAEFRTHMVAKVREHGVDPHPNGEKHGFTPHLTLGFSDDPITTLPEVPEQIRGADEIFGSIWMVWGEEWTEVTLP